ncbi:SDR family NAD(P)-dependent oxidoreductase [Corynebacterium choanae]|uniref:Serine 3-dehydrogenase n=1 Tax=Corynebacterium choanae TaxID=1862358 RepID=A0A3G6J9T5_9CORY|nr:SDR family NAD(P)-dependent oxidoreductase [Corynebacterium choanae]AZA14669.1 Serine 3-dehydrogenase [Corynebacterium choanae]
MMLAGIHASDHNPTNRPRTIVVTGATSGIGLAATTILLQRGHRVIGVGRNTAAATALADLLGNEWLTCDYTDFDSVRALAQAISNRTDHIDVLANNAGRHVPHFALTGDGYETTLQVNHLSPLLLTMHLLPLLANGEGIVEMTSSVAGRWFHDYRASDFNRQRRRYQPLAAYSDSKLLNAMVARELSSRFSRFGIFGVSFHPGLVSSQFASDDRSWLGLFYRSKLTRPWLLPPSKAAGRLVYLADGEIGKEIIPGGYYENNRLAKTSSVAYDRAVTAHAWEASLAMIGIDEDEAVAAIAAEHPRIQYPISPARAAE